jgi:RNA polymerase sigma-70 factor (ECF subfamily)
MKISQSEFERLAMEQLDMLYRIARRLTRDEASAEDLVQETMLRAFRSASSFDLKEFGIRPWLVRILRNLHNTRYKQDKHEPVADDQLLASVEAQEPVPISGPGSELWENVDQQLMHAVESLPAEYQEVLMLWAIEEMSYQEIASALEVPIGTVMSRLFRARQKLSEQLKDFAAKQGLLRQVKT